MESIDIDLKDIMQNKQINLIGDMFLYHDSNLFYKVLITNRASLKHDRVELSAIAKTLHRLEALSINEIDNVCFPQVELHAYNQFCGYGSNYLDGYDSLSNVVIGMNIKDKINLLVQVSQTLKSLHQRGIIHNDLHGYNVMSKNGAIRFIDFDNSHISKVGSSVPYVRSVQCEMLSLIDLILDTLYPDDKTVNLPDDINDYVNSFEQYALINSRKNVLMSVPGEYPHDWLPDLGDYLEKKDYVKNHKRRKIC